MLSVIKRRLLLNKYILINLDIFDSINGGLLNEFVDLLFAQVGRDGSARYPEGVAHYELHPNLGVELLEELFHIYGSCVCANHEPTGKKCRKLARKPMEGSTK